MNPLSAHKKDINLICSNHRVKHLYVFGSSLTDQYHQESDIDLMVEFLPIHSLEYADNYYDLKYALELILNRRIDLLEEKAIKNPFFLQSIQESKQKVYEN